MFSCIECGERVPDGRKALGIDTCTTCGEIQARRKKHTIVPMHKSNYMVVTDLRLLKGINNKGGLVK